MFNDVLSSCLAWKGPQ